MSERKVLNKYYPPEYDPSNIPKVRQEKNRQWNIRIMAPFNMRCETCGEYIYKGKKFNSRKEDVEDDDYLGLKIFRFYIKCPRCVAEIAFRTDPQNTDYSLEGGATRNFEASRTAEQLAQQKVKEKEEEEANNPMKVLENRTKASQREMDMIETLEELRELNARQSQVDHNKMLALHTAYEQHLEELQDQEDESFIKSVFGKNGESSIKRIIDDDEKESNSADVPPKKILKSNKPTDILCKKPSTNKTTDIPSWQRSVGSLSSKASLGGLVKKPLVKPKQPSTSQDKQALTSTEDKQQTVVGTNSSAAHTSDEVVSLGHTENTDHIHDNISKNTSTPEIPASKQTSGALGLLGSYSDSNSGSDSD